MEGLRFVGSVYFDLVKWSQNLVIDWPPTIVFDSFVPTLVFIIFWPVELYVDRLFLLLFFYLIVISGRKRIYVAHRSMDKNLVVNQRWELQSSKSEPHMGFRGWVE